MSKPRKVLFTALCIEVDGCLLYRKALIDAGYDVRTTDDDQLLQQMRRGYYDLVVLIGSGVDFIPALKQARAKGIKTPVLYVKVLSRNRVSLTDTTVIEYPGLDTHVVVSKAYEILGN